jgi:hypothetical protein
MHPLNPLFKAYRLNARMYNLALAYVASALVLRFPWLLGWMPVEQQGMAFGLADTITKFAIGLAIWWAKDKLLSGNGSTEKPFKKAQ